MIDCHLHLQMPAFRGHLGEIIDQTRDLGIEILVVNGTQPDDWPEVAEIAGKYPEVIPFFGVHPWRVSMLREGWEKELENWLSKLPHAGVGEIGLDKWIRDHDITRQKEVFLEQLRIAEQFSRPVTIHCLQAWGHLSECLEKSEFSGNLLLHSYGGPAEMVDEFVRRGAFFSMSGYFFREEKVAKREVFSGVPANRLLLETDAPDMMPPEALVEFPLRDAETGEAINHPGNLSSIYRAAAEWKKIEVSDMVELSQRNFRSYLG